MPRKLKPTNRIQGMIAVPEYDNGGEVVILWNPAPYISREELREAEESGTPIQFHRENTTWLLTVPTMNVTMPIEENGTPLKGFQEWQRMLKLADSIITQLKSLKPAELLDYQSEVYESRQGLTYFAKMIPTGR